jgi:uncharacterized membrane protein
MAGIGFKLRRLADDETLAGFIKGYVGAAAVCAGPWILTIVSLCLADFVANRFGVELNPKTQLIEPFSGSPLFHAIVTYCYAVSLCLTGGLQNVVTRYLSDRLYKDDDTYHLPCFLGCLLILHPVTALVGAFVFATIQAGLALKVVSVLLLVVVADIWLAMIFLGAVRAYIPIVNAYVVGTLASLAAVAYLAPYGDLGLVSGFLIGQACVLLAMVRILMREFSCAQRSVDFGFLPYFRTHPFLHLSGTFLYVGVWSGVLYYWNTPYAFDVSGLRVYPMHDISYFWGLLTTIPAMTFFFVRTETEFYDGYRDFFGGITEGKARYSDLSQKKAEMRECLTRGAGDLVKVQGWITFAVLFFTPELLEPFHMKPEWASALRMGALGAFFLCHSQFTVMILYYYEAYLDAFLSCFLMFAINLALCHLTLSWGESWHGIGLVVGSLVAIGFAVWRLSIRLEALEYYTFMFQPMPGHLPWVQPDEAFGKTIRKDSKWLVPVE